MALKYCFSDHTEYNSESTKYTATTATRVETINYGTKNGITVAGTNDYVHGNTSNIPFSHDGSFLASF